MKGKKGFTLIELLIVIAIIGILAAIIMTALGGGRSKSRDAKRISEIKQVRYALELYYDKFKQYPTCLVPGGSCTTVLQGSGFIGSIPTDPTTGSLRFTYAALGSGTNCSSYHMGVSLENKSNLPLNNDADASSAAGICTGSAANFHGLSYTAGGVACDTTAGVAQPTSGATGESCLDFIP